MARRARGDDVSVLPRCERVVADGVVRHPGVDVRWYAFVRIARSAVQRCSPTWWLGLGAAIGLGMMTKFTMPALVAGVGVGVLLTPIRRELRTPGRGWVRPSRCDRGAEPGVAGRARVAEHRLPAGSERPGQRRQPDHEVHRGPAFTLGPFVLIFCGAGALRLWRGQRERALLWTAVTVELVYLVFHGKGYYPLDVVPVLIAAGSVSVATWKRWRVVAIGLIVFGLVALPVVLPVLPESTMIRFDLDKARDDFSAELGWPTVVSSIARAYDALPAQERGRDHPHGELQPGFGGQRVRWSVPAPARAERSQHLLDVAAAPRVDQHGFAVGFPSSELRQWFGRVRSVGRYPRPPCRRRRSAARRCSCGPVP